MIATTRPEISVSEPTLYVAFELGKKEWKLAMTSGFGVAPWLRSVASGDWGGVERALTQGRARLGVRRRVTARCLCVSGGLSSSCVFVIFVLSWWPAAGDASGRESEAEQSIDFDDERGVLEVRKS